MGKLKREYCIFWTLYYLKRPFFASLLPKMSLSEELAIIDMKYIAALHRSRCKLSVYRAEYSKMRVSSDVRMEENNLCFYYHARHARHLAAGEGSGVEGGKEEVVW